MKTRLVDILGVALLVIIALLLTGINQPVTTRDVYQYIDHDAQVVCYILENGNGISCLPLDEIRQVGE